ncbi:MAG: type II toxin-antitoxin system RelE/ParE family toxin [Patescibacteria group bacterium]
MSKIYYYLSVSKKDAVSEFIDSLEKTTKSKLFDIFEHFKKYGVISAVPHTKKLTGTKLWEIKLIGKKSVRVLYAVVLRGDVLIILGFIKKSQKTPQKYIKTALARLEDWKNRNSY